MDMISKWEMINSELNKLIRSAEDDIVDRNEE